MRSVKIRRRDALIPPDTGLDLFPLVERDGASGADAPESLDTDESISRAAGISA
jgi:hypothetical protein